MEISDVKDRAISDFTTVRSITFPCSCMLPKVPNIPLELKISNLYLEATQMVVDILENVNKIHEN